MSLIKILIGLLSINLLVLVHELGHYWAARLFKIRIKTFSIGLGKKLLRYQGKHCEFVISAIPLGGYCRFDGEQNMIQAWEKKLDHIPKEEGTLYSLTPWKRIIVSLAGPLANAFFSLLILFPFSWMSTQEFSFESRIVAAGRYRTNLNEEPYPSERFGLQDGDLITHCNGEEIENYSELEAFIQSNPEKQIEMRIQRNGSEITLDVIPSLNDETNLGFLGIFPYMSNTLVDDLSYRGITIPKGSTVIDCDGTEISALSDLFFYSWDNEYVQVSFTNSTGSIKTVEISQRALDYQNVPIPYQIITLDGLSFNEGLQSTIQNYFEYWTLTFKGFLQLFSRNSSSGQLMGPLRTSWFAGETSIVAFKYGIKQGLFSMVSFLAPLGIGLAFLNLLPIPVLDGGQIILFLIDWIKSKSLKPQFIFRYQLLGSIVVLSLMILAISMDIMFFVRSRI